MNTHDKIVLPPLPEWADTTLQGKDRDSLFAWAEAAIEADRQARGEPVDIRQEVIETLEMILAADWRKWEELASPDEFVRWAKSRANYALSIINEAPQPAEPVNVPSAHEINQLWIEVRHQDARTQTGHILAFAIALLSKYAAPQLQQQAGEPVAWRDMKNAPKDGTAVLVLIPDSDIPKSVRWRDDCREMTWDGHQLSEYDQPRYWMPCPSDPDASPHSHQQAGESRKPASERIIGEIKLDAHHHPYARLSTGYDENGNQWKDGTPFYAAPQIPEPCTDYRHHERYVAGWNACRATMLEAAPTKGQ